MRYREQEGTRLSPAYDIVCSKLVIPGEEDCALTLNGKKNNLTRKDFDALADLLEIPQRVRYEKFEGKEKAVKELIAGSRLPGDLKKTFAEIVLSRYERLKM